MSRSVRLTNKQDNQYDSLLLPITFANQRIGFLSVNISLQTVKDKIYEAIALMSIISACVVILILLVSQRLVNKFTSPILKLTSASLEMANGNLEQKIEIDSKDELGILATNFSKMRYAIKNQITDLNKEIEERKRAEAKRKRSEEELAKQRNQLKEMNQELQQLDKLKDEFLANTSHELRTPLNGIIGIAESLIDGATGELNEKTNANLAMIANSGKRLSSLVDDILDFSKLKHQNIGLQLKPLELNSIVDMVLTLSQPLIAQKKINFVNAVNLDLPSVFADENRLQQILHNLIGNAIKFTEQGYIIISAQVIGEQVQVIITDDGIGIPADKLNSIFKSFEQAEGSTSRDYGGTGLGLTVTKKLVELHKGKIWVESKLNVGSKFIFTLPSSQEPAVPISSNHSKLTHIIHTEAQENSDVKTVTDVATFKVLIVDDEPVNLQVLHNYLSLQNYSILQATSGREALKFIDDGFLPDIILLDVMMPKMTGYEVTHKLREKWQALEMPILLLTAKNQVEDLVRGLEAGANDYMTKPISKGELLARVKTHLSLKTLTADNLRMGTELDIAKQLQQMVLPKETELQQIDNLDIAGFMEPAEEVGGDYYEVLNHDGNIKIGIGDVTGHGLESGVLMLMVQTTVRALLLAGIDNPEQFLNIVNRTVYHNVQRMETDKNLTLSLLDYQAGKLTITGQHEEILLIRKDGKVELIDTFDLGFMVGIIANITKFTSHQELTLKPGDGIVLFTDGITEAQNVEEQQYGLERLCEVVGKSWSGNSKEVQQAVIADVKDYIGKQKVLDDITLLVLKQI
ncbi:SpoIIE family protein phosphatase [Candidatus Halobeggiatoa sp. HSG11]|nr:SpoIIE family protein phosphatase [Candidatus Halobeggiatoa sp. HSG11]